MNPANITVAGEHHYDQRITKRRICRGHVSFYRRERFEIQCSVLDEATGGKDYVIEWQKKLHS